MGSSLSVHGHNVKVTEVLKDGDALTFLIVSEKVSSAAKKRVNGHRTGTSTCLMCLFPCS